MTRASSAVLGMVVMTLAMASTPAHAQAVDTDSRAMPVAGNTPQVCALQPAQVRTSNLVNFVGVAGEMLQIAELTDRRTLSANPASATVAFSAVCNFPHRLRLESENNGLWPTDGRMTSDAEGFAFALPYHARVTWGSATGDFIADAKVRRLATERVNVDAPTAGDLSLRIEIEAGASNVRANAPVLAGVYGDTLRIYLEPR